MIRTIKYHPSHARLLDLNEAYEGQVEVLESYKDTDGFFMESIIKDHGPGKTYEFLGVISGCIVVPGTFEVSALIGKSARKYPVGFFKQVQLSLKFYEILVKARRTQVTIRKGFPFLLKWIEMLGFEREGLMRKFGPEGDDYYLYARVKE